MRKQLTLKELCYAYSSDETDLEPKDQHDADSLVRIFDAYAVGFARWIQESPMIFNNGKSMEQALEIYKESKQL